MDERTYRRHHALAAFAGLLAAIGVLVIAIAFVVLVAWMVFSKQDSKLYEADNQVCVSQPFQVTCFERKAR